MKLIESIQIKFMNEETNDLISRHIIRNYTGKFSHTVLRDGFYKICAQNVVASWLANTKVFMSIKITTDTHDEMLDVNNVVSNEDVNGVTSKISKIISSARKILESQASEIKGEDLNYNLQSEYSKTLVTFTIIQILAVTLVGVFHLFSFRNFLRVQKII